MPVYGLPVRPAGAENWTEEQPAEIVTRDCMIGVALPRPNRKSDDVRPVHRLAGRSIIRTGKRRPVQRHSRRFSTGLSQIK
jgi:hypothetical protein